MPHIQFQDAEAVYSGRRILHPINLDLTEHRIGIIGANGGGKSTLARLINGLGPITGGRVLVDGLDVTKQPKKVRNLVGFIFSDADNQIVMPTVAEDVEFSLSRMKLTRSEKQQRVHAVLSEFGLADHANTSAHVLSGGQKQMLALASVMVLNPKIIIADEPTTLLDLRNRLQIKRVFSHMEQQIIVVSHDLEFISDFDRIIRIGNGEVIDDGQPDQVLPRYIEDMRALDDGAVGNQKPEGEPS